MKKNSKTKQVYIAPVNLQNPEFKIPTKGSETAHCFDLCVGEDFTILPNEIKKVATGFKMQLPKDCAVLIRERSSTITKHDINVEAGDIDSDYRGHVWIVFYRKPSVSLLNAFRHAIVNTGGCAKVRDYERLIAEKGSEASVIRRFLRDAYYVYIPGLWRTVNVIKSTVKYWWRRNKAVTFPKYTRLAQMEVVQIIPAEFDVVSTLAETKRGSGGFGSTGQTSIVTKKKTSERKPRNRKIKKKTESVQTETQTKQET